MQYRVGQRKNTKQLFNIIRTSIQYIIYGKSEVTEKSIAKNHTYIYAAPAGMSLPRASPQAMARRMVVIVFP